MRFGPSMAAYQEVLGAKLSAKQRAMLQLALSFFTWRTLVRESGLKPERRRRGHGSSHRLRK